LISASQKIKVRLSFERVHDDQRDKGWSPSRAGEATTSADDAANGVTALRAYPGIPPLEGE
jgi:hypothetical protein